MIAANDNAVGYRVFHKGKMVAGYHLFVDAWLHAKLECQFWTKIIGPPGEGMWIIIPYQNRVLYEVRGVGGIPSELESESKIPTYEQ